MCKIKSIAANKISPTFMIGNSLDIKSRDLKYRKAPPKRSIDCDAIFYEYTAKDNSKITLLKDYTGKICEDIINNNFINQTDLRNKLSLKDLVLTKKGDELSGTKLILYLTSKLNFKIINLSNRHKAQNAKVNSLSVCFLELEQKSILESNLLSEYQKARLSQQPNELGRLII